MKKRWGYGLIFLSALIIVVIVGGRLFFWANKDVYGNMPEYVLLYAENQTDDYPTTMGAHKFADLVYVRSGGRIRIEVKCDAELGSEMQVIEQLKFGGVSFARVSLSQLAEFEPEMNILQLPYLYKDSEHMWRVLDGKIGDDFLKKTSDIGIVGLSWYDAGARNFYSTLPIRKLEDLEGLNIRVQESDMMADMVSALLANPVKIVYSDVYSAIEQGIVDCAENNWPSYDAMKHYDVARFYTVDEHTRVPELQICSKVIWDKLDEKDQQIILDCAKESSLYERKLWQESEKSSRENAEKNGVTVIELSESEKARFRNAMSAVYEKYCGNQMELINEISEY